MILETTNATNDFDRTIIGVVEQSVELVRRSLQLQRAKNRNQEYGETKREHQPQQYDTMETVGVAAAAPARRQRSRDPGGQSAARFLCAYITCGLTFKSIFSYRLNVFSLEF